MCNGLIQDYLVKSNMVENPEKQTAWKCCLDQYPPMILYPVKLLKKTKRKRNPVLIMITWRKCLILSTLKRVLFVTFGVYVLMLFCFHDYSYFQILSILKIFSLRKKVEVKIGNGGLIFVVGIWFKFYVMNVNGGLRGRKTFVEKGYKYTFAPAGPVSTICYRSCHMQIVNMRGSNLKANI